MTREEALEELKEIRFNLNYKVNGTSRFDEALDMAIKALEQEPTYVVDRVTIKEYLESVGNAYELGKEKGLDIALDILGKYTEEGNEKIIRDLPSETPQPCADMVSRDAMWEVLQRLYGTEGELVEELMSLPPVLPMPKIGKWIYKKKEDSYRCSLCAFPCHKDNLGAIPTKYCAGCGAAMEVQND